MRLYPLVLLVTAFGLSACSGGESPPPQLAVGQGERTLPTEHTLQAQAQARRALDAMDPLDFQESRRGLLAEVEEGEIRGPKGDLVWDLGAGAFLEGEAPGTVNPSLWRQAKLSSVAGLFEVIPGVYQVRGFDLANMTLIEGETGWIVVDPLTTFETGKAAFAFAMTHLKKAPVSAFVYTHSHVDHFGGVFGVLDAHGDSRGIPVVAPVGFLKEATSENMLAGQAMARRAELMYGRALERSPWGHITMGLGPATAFGTMGVLPPTLTIPSEGGNVEIDGIPFEFMDIAGSEAPSEFAFYLPKAGVLHGGELVSRTLHNLYTLRGAKVRDALLWSNLMDEAIDRFGAVEIYIGGHLWPMWGAERIRAFMEAQRDAYKFIHDQTLRHANGGASPKEIAEVVALPDAIGKHAFNRGYYGTVSHNTKAVYQAYFGWYDGNPAHLNPLPEVEAARRYVDMMGGADALLEKAQGYYDKGDYRWVAEVLNHLVFAEPDHEGGRALLASTYDQLGYQAESAPWRDVYLTGAMELRTGTSGTGADLSRVVELFRQTPLPLFLAALSTRVKGDQGEGKDVEIALNFKDLDTTYRLSLSNGVLHHTPAPPREETEAVITLTFPLFLKLASGGAGAMELMNSDALEIEGSKLALIRFFSQFEKTDPGFNIVRP